MRTQLCRTRFEGKNLEISLQALKGLEGRGLSLAALIASGCVISRSDFNIFMLWLQNANVDLLDVGDLDSHAAKS